MLGNHDLFILLDAVLDPTPETRRPMGLRVSQYPYSFAHPQVSLLKNTGASARTTNHIRFLGRLARYLFHTPVKDWDLVPCYMHVLVHSQEYLEAGWSPPRDDDVELFSAYMSVRSTLCVNRELLRCCRTDDDLMLHSFCGTQFTASIGIATGLRKQP